MSSEQQEPSKGDRTQRKPTSELWGPWVLPDDDGTKKRAASGTQFKKPFEPPATPAGKNEVSSDIDPQATFREHVTATAPSLPVVPPAPGFSHPQQPQQPPQIPPAQAFNPVSYSGYPPPVTGIPGNAGNPPAQAFPPPVIGSVPPGTSYPNFAVPSPSYQGYTSGPPLPAATHPMAPITTMPNRVRHIHIHTRIPIHIRTHRLSRNAMAIYWA